MQIQYCERTTTTTKKNKRVNEDGVTIGYCEGYQNCILVEADVATVIQGAQHTD